MKAENFSIKPILKDMVATELISSTEATRIYSNFKEDDKSHLNPLIAISSTIPSSKKQQGKKINLTELCEWAAKQTNLTYYHIDPLKIDVGPLMDVVSYEYAEQHSILPIKATGTSVTFATAKPHTMKWHQELEQLLNREVSFVFSNPKEIDKFRSEFYTLAQSISEAKVNNTTGDIKNSLDQLVELGRTGQLDAEHHHVIQVVDWLLQYAFDQRASDIHIEPRREQGNIRFRIDGALTHIYELPPAVIGAVTSRLKILARMDLAEKRKPQDGRIKTLSPSNNEVELRLATMPTAFGEKLVMRIFDPDVLLRSFEDLGLVNDDYQRWVDMAERPNGILLVTGPTGSGKTTTLYSTLKMLARPDVNVCTIEDPIEMVEPAFNQMQIQSKIDLTFASGVRALMRQDPDIIMIGEIRDPETAEMAVQAALTGHLVISTVHTNDAPSAISRLLELGIPAYLLRATLLGIMAQRLVRTLCENCKEPAEIDDDIWRELTTPWSASKPEQVYKSVGCMECRNTGYYGRKGIYEILPMSRELGRLITDDFDLVKLREQGMREGMRTLRLAGAHKIAAGLTTAEEVIRTAPAVDR